MPAPTRAPASRGRSRSKALGPIAQPLERTVTETTGRSIIVQRPTARDRGLLAAGQSRFVEQLEHGHGRELRAEWDRVEVDRVRRRGRVQQVRAEPLRAEAIRAGAIRAG